MHKLTRNDLFTLEAYASERNAFRSRVLAHKRVRRVALGAHVTLLFEDRLTLQYQVQEMLRIERIFEAAGIEEELAAYNPLVPDGSNLKATMLIEYDDAGQRKHELEKLRGIEDCISVRVDGHAAVRAVADEDIPRSNESKTSAVHFLRFEFTPPMIDGLRSGARLTFACEHAHCALQAEAPPDVRTALIADFD